MALSLTNKGVGRGEREGEGEGEAGALTAAMGQPARDPLSIRGAWQPSYVPPSTPASV